MHMQAATTVSHAAISIMTARQPIFQLPTFSYTTYTYY